MDALWFDAIVPAAAVKPADVAPEATVTEAGTLSSELFEDNDTAAPPEGAEAFSVTVQVVEVLESRLPDAQLSDETVGFDGAPAAIVMLRLALEVW
jgi:hypothetical protein